MSVPAAGASLTEAIFPVCETLPRTAKLQRELKVPLAIHFQPFADKVQKVSRAPVRCKRCKAYLSPMCSVSGNEFRCCICGRANPVPAWLGEQLMGERPVELSANAVDYVVSERQYLPATADAAGVEVDLLAPAEMSHVQANVYADPVVNQCIKPSTRIYQSGKDLQTPTSRRLDQKQVPVRLDIDRIQDIPNSGADPTLQTLQFIQIVIIQVTKNTISQGLIPVALQAIVQQLNEHTKIFPVFVMHTGLVFDVCAGEAVEMAIDQQSGEPVLPLPLNRLAWTKEFCQENVEMVLKYVYNSYNAYLQYDEARTLKYSGDILAGCVSSLQRTGGQITVVVTDSF